MGIGQACAVGSSRAVDSREGERVVIDSGDGVGRSVIIQSRRESPVGDPTDADRVSCFVTMRFDCVDGARVAGVD